MFTEDFFPSPLASYVEFTLRLKYFTEEQVIIAR